MSDDATPKNMSPWGLEWADVRCDWTSATVVVRVMARNRDMWPDEGPGRVLGVGVPFAWVEVPIPLRLLLGDGNEWRQRLNAYMQQALVVGQKPVKGEEVG